MYRPHHDLTVGLICPLLTLLMVCGVSCCGFLFVLFCDYLTLDLLLQQKKKEKKI